MPLLSVRSPPPCFISRCSPYFLPFPIAPSSFFLRDPSFSFHSFGGGWHWSQEGTTFCPQLPSYLDPEHFFSPLFLPQFRDKFQRSNNRNLCNILSSIFQWLSTSKDQKMDKSRIGETFLVCISPFPYPILTWKRRRKKSQRWSLIAFTFRFTSLDPTLSPRKKSRQKERELLFSGCLLLTYAGKEKPPADIKERGGVCEQCVRRKSNYRSPSLPYECCLQPSLPFR